MACRQLIRLLFSLKESKKVWVRVFFGQLRVDYLAEGDVSREAIKIYSTAAPPSPLCPAYRSSSSLRELSSSSWSKKKNLPYLIPRSIRLQVLSCNLHLSFATIDIFFDYTISRQ